MKKILLFLLIFFDKNKIKFEKLMNDKHKIYLIIINKDDVLKNKLKKWK